MYNNKAVIGSLNTNLMAVHCLQVVPMDCLMGESMKLSKTDQKLIKHLNLVMYFDFPSKTEDE